MDGKVRAACTSVLVAAVLLSGIWAQDRAAGSGEPSARLSWATSAVGSAGHRAMTGLAITLGREMPELRIDVVPTASAMASIRGYALGNFDAYYGADVAFREYATDSGRFRGFPARASREPLQSFWVYTVEVGVAVHARDATRYRSWRDLDGATIFSGPAGWDVRAQLDLAFDALAIGYRYRELDTGLTGGALNEGSIDAFIIYTAGESSPAAWVSEALLAADAVAVNPTGVERAQMRDAGVDTVDVRAGVFRGGIGTDSVTLSPFYYGFHVGAEVDEDIVYRILVAIERNADRLARADAVFAQVADDMAGLQRRAVAASVDYARVHPGLARWMRERGVWNPHWDDRVVSE